MQVDVLVFAAHPDDAELNCGGTIAALVAQGKSVGIIDLTKGEMGTRGTPKSRAGEVSKASEILGITYRKNLDLSDSFIENTRENQLKVIDEVRKCRSEICLLGAPYDRHPDHGKATQLCMDALFYSGLRKIETEQSEPWRPKHIFNYMQDRPFEPDFIYDISDHWETKKKAVQAFSTQFNVENPGDEPETYISSNKYFKQLEARARYFGHLAGFEFGEPFKVVNGPLGLTSFDDFFD
ncbi:MAG: bacillithiol biosynthesis deacetylase BshB1 [Balneolaceae bacterium]|nr:bacillithiol biosynthesis deacetylase BshB1 [Balneolaceae bacterium]MBO6546586.1 bacillithiol biosynthesis deacetylase BshB1 [Balneolaceae bacterium]MBO6648945.1 bacillithiol biosynthesis deacetylase BshB1 [Balneolaceae bacterium]